MRLHYLSLIFFTGISRSVFGQDSGPNLFKWEISEIVQDQGISITKEELNGINVLRISVESVSRPDAAVYFTSMKLTPGKQYTFMIASEPHIQHTSAHFIPSDVGNIVWPGNPLINGISVSQFTMPDSASNVRLAFAFQNAQPGDYIFIKDVALFEGFVPASSWQLENNESLRRTFKDIKFLFEIVAVIVSVIVVVLIILLEKRIPDQSNSVKQ